VNDRQDLVARVFRLKLTAWLEIIKKGKLFGTPTGIVDMVEFQKRGLPHVHGLLIIGTDEPWTAERIDAFVRTNLPDPVTEKDLFDVVTTHVLHGPCGVSNPSCPCMDPDTRTCTKHFPKPFQESTALSDSDTGLLAHGAQWTPPPGMAL